ncbi:MAG: DUF4124 domain-containing protein [Deltaproteobacteria bacterium]|jgi:hypothetical protein|nr:DUF4124 domain-containing protein [Deltaproteobacteria bacterium]
MGTLFCLLVQQNIHAQTLYTWKDAAGTIHISKQKPPADQPLTDRIRYAARRSSQPKIETASPAAAEADAVLAATRQAKLTREQAEKARRMAEDAIQEAHQVKRETDAFLEPWRSRKRVSNPILLQIESRIQNANQAIAKAEHLIESANQAEQEAQAAENNARRIQKQFVEAYTKIITN